jgi:catechol 2,3-dioxygenase-like lactoylglutathione lyase family enzyme
MTGVPGLAGVEHIAFTVPDLEEAIAFFTQVLGCERLYDMGPFADPTGTWMEDNLDVHPRAEIDNFALLRCANGANFELFQYRSPDQVTRWPRMSDHGGSHVAFYVEDKDAALAHLQQCGVRVLGEGKKAGIGPEAGEDSTFAHFLAPWGQLLEFVSYPRGRASFNTTDRRGWRPTAQCQS